MHLLTAFLGAILFSTGTLAAPDKNEPQLNILLLTVDSFRPDRLGCYGAARAHTPNIDRLARRGVIFTKAYSTAAWTNASLVSMLTGLYPSVHGVERRGVSLPEEWVTPLELLREAGYLVPENIAQEYYDHLAVALVDNRHEIPYTVDGSIGKTWGDIKHLDDIWDESEDDDDD